MSTVDVVVVCGTLLGCYAMYLRAAHENTRALKLALTTCDDVSELNTELKEESTAHSKLTKEVLLEHNNRISALELKLNKLVMR